MENGVTAPIINSRITQLLTWTLILKGDTKILNQTCGVRTIIYFFLGKQSFRNYLCSL